MRKIFSLFFLLLIQIPLCKALIIGVFPDRLEFNRKGQELQLTIFNTGDAPGEVLLEEGSGSFRISQQRVRVEGEGHSSVMIRAIAPCRNSTLRLKAIGDNFGFEIGVPLSLECEKARPNAAVGLLLSFGIACLGIIPGAVRKIKKN